MLSGGSGQSLWLSGECPFRGDDLPAIAYATVHETPAPLSQRVAGLPAALDRCLGGGEVVRLHGGVEGIGRGRDLVVQGSVARREATGRGLMSLLPMAAQYQF